MDQCRGNARSRSVTTRFFQSPRTQPQCLIGDLSLRPEKIRVEQRRRSGVVTSVITDPRLNEPRQSPSAFARVSPFNLGDNTLGRQLAVARQITEVLKSLFLRLSGATDREQAEEQEYKNGECTKLNQHIT